MVRIIIKDLYILKQAIFMFIAIACIGLMFDDIPFNSCVFLISTLSVLFSLYREQEKLLNSLPYSRKQIVSSKYVSSLIMTTMAVILVAGIQFLMSLMVGHSIQTVSWETILSSYLLVMLWVSCNLPLMYYYEIPSLLRDGNFEGINIFEPNTAELNVLYKWLLDILKLLAEFIIYMMPFISILVLGSPSNKLLLFSHNILDTMVRFFPSIPEVLLYFTLILIMCLIYVVSWKVSIRIYERKDF